MGGTDTRGAAGASSLSEPRRGKERCVAGLCHRCPRGLSARRNPPFDAIRWVTTRCAVSVFLAVGIVRVTRSLPSCDR